MNTSLFYASAGVLLFCFGLFALVVRPHLLYKILALNVAGSGVFLTYIALAFRGNGSLTDPVPQAMVLTGIVIAVSTTALALALSLKLKQLTGAMRLPAQKEEGSE